MREARIQAWEQESEGKSNGGRPGSAQETETDTTFERLAGDPSEGEVLLRMERTPSGPQWAKVLWILSRHGGSLWRAGRQLLEQEVTDPGTEKRCVVTTNA